METNSTLKEKKHQGFTIIELIVVLAMFGVLAAVVVADYNRQRQSREVKAARDVLVSDLGKMLNAALLNREIRAGVPAFSFGIQFNNRERNKYKLVVFDRTIDQQPTELSIVVLPSNKYISMRVRKSDRDRTEVDVSELTVYFTVPYGRVLHDYMVIPPPDPRLQTLGEANDVSTITISQGEADGRVSKSVVVNGVTGSIAPQ